MRRVLWFIAGMAVLAVLLGVVAALTLRWVVADKDDVIAHHAKALLVLEDYVVADARAARKTRAYLLTANERFAVERNQARDEMARLFVDVQPRVETEEGKRLLARIAELQAAAGKETDSLVARRRAGLSAEASGHALETELQPLRDELDEAIGALKRHKERLLQDAKAQSERGASTAFTLLVAAIVGALGAMGVLGYLLVRAYRGLTESVEFQARVIGIVGHDVRSPLTSILATAGHAAADTATSEQARRGWNRVLRAARRIDALARLLVDFTRSKMSRALPLAPSRGNVHEVCAEVVADILLVTPSAQVEHRRSGNGTGDFDPDRLHQAVSNLVDNALRHGAQSSPVLVESNGENPSVLKIRVENNGPQIPTHLMPALFDPFTYGDAPADVPVRESLGMGLYIVREVVRAHGGQVDVDSTAERTVFTIRLPRIPAET